jgi:murein DD-endopeptidase MepM/ murein hydrolase activator NlpD
LLLLTVVLVAALAGSAVYAAEPPQEAAALPKAAVSGVKVSLPERDITMTWPVPGFFTASENGAFGERYSGTDFHTGVDISDEDIYGATVVAAESGTIVKTVTEYAPGLGYGKNTVIDHGNGISTMYAHLDEILIKTGDRVEKGQAIAKVGSTGSSTEPHLHFEVRENGVSVDPSKYFTSGDAEKFSMVVKAFKTEAPAASTEAVIIADEVLEEYIWPLKGEFRVNCKINGYPGHTGIDLVPKNTKPVLTDKKQLVAAPIYAAKSGTVVRAKNNGWGYGRHIIIDHGDGTITYYAHCTELLVEEGDKVEQGREIAKTGATGNAYGEQLHFEIRIEGEIADPEAYLPELD